jgi:hypothetical protein
MLGVLFTGWSVGGDGERLTAALRDGGTGGKSQDIVQQVAASIKAGLKALAEPRE